MFIAVLGLAALVAALAVLVPAWRARGESADEAAADHVRRLDELAADVAAGDVAAADAVLVRAEIERAVLAAVPPSAASPGRARRGLLALIVLAVVAASIPLYQHLGSPRLADFALRHPGLDVGQPHNAVEVMLEQVRERTRTVPDDVEAWTVLGRTTLALGQYDEALDAAERAHALAPDDVPGLLLLIDALAMHDGGRFGPRARELVARVRELDPDNITALVLTGIIHEQSGARAQALATWREALSRLPPDAPFRSELKMMIAGVGGDAESAQTPPGEARRAADEPPATRALDVSVSVAAGLATDLPPDTAVFVLARQPGGPPAPLAVQRLRLADLPAKVHLDESMAMIPGHGLADVDTVEVVARISRSGAPLPRNGDLEGRSGVVPASDNGALEIVIDKVVE